MLEEVFTMILKDGTANGIVECNIDEWYGIAYKIPRTRLKEAKNLRAIHNSGVYILFGLDETDAEKIAYIGEAEDIYNRLKEQNRDKDFWNECLVFMSENNALNKAHIKHIEHELHDIAKRVNRYIITNEVTPQNSTLSHADEIKSKKFIERVKTISGMFGYKLFDELIENRVDDENILYLTNNGITYGKAIVSDEGFVILKGSRIKGDIATSLSPSLVNYCIKERASRDIKDGVFIENHLCSSPSMAAVLILGRNSNGRVEWKNKDGISFRELENQI